MIEIEDDINTIKPDVWRNEINVKQLKHVALLKHFKNPKGKNKASRDKLAELKRGVQA